MSKSVFLVCDKYNTLPSITFPILYASKTFYVRICDVDADYSTKFNSVFQVDLLLCSPFKSVCLQWIIIYIE